MIARARNHINYGISFVIPAFNCARTLREAVESIYSGNFTKEDETIIVDDASTDKTLPIAKLLQKKYPNIHIYRHHYNKGSAAAGRNTAIENSKNDLIFCLDADNILSQSSIPKLNEYMFQRKADVAALGELHYFKKSIQKVTHKWTFKKRVTLVDYLKDNKSPGASGNYLFSKQTWLKAGRYNESVGGAYDSWIFGFCQLASGAHMVTMPNSLYYHRYGYESTFVKESQKKNSSLVILQGIFPFIDVISEKDIDYIMSPDAKYTWFENLKNRPITLRRKPSFIKKIIFKHS